MRSLPLFHRIAGRPVIVLGEGAAAEPKRRLVERAGGIVADSIEEGADKGARLAFVAYDDGPACEVAARQLREMGLLVNVVDRPELCDFTTPSILERDPVLIAIGTSGASAGLAKHLRLRLEGLLPQSLGLLAQRLADGRDALRRRWPSASERRQALDAALGQGGALDLFDGDAAGRVDGWIAGGAAGEAAREITLDIVSDDPEQLTLRQARLLGSADMILHEPGIAPAVLARARADAVRHALPGPSGTREGLVLVLRRRF